MRYKEKVVSNIDAVVNQLNSLRNMVDNNSITKELLLSEMQKLATRLEDVSEMVGLEDADFRNLNEGIKSFQR